jgi:5-formyltetrahydrofolate cyclo-ligase
MTARCQNKINARTEAKSIRRNLVEASAAFKLISHFPETLERPVIAGFAPLGDEIDIWPLLKHLHQHGSQICLPVTPDGTGPLSFRKWSPDSPMETDRYGVAYPVSGPLLTPKLVLVPLLAFTRHGDRLGYGGGYYDRTLQTLRQAGEVFACGVAYAGQEMERLPTDAHDERLDGILTETRFKAFT